MVLYNERKTVTCRSQVKNPVWLRRFTSPHPSSFFLDFLAANEGLEGGRVIGGPVARWSGDRPPPPPPRPAHLPPRLLRLHPYRVYFSNFSKPRYIFVI